MRRQNSRLPAVCVILPLYHAPFHIFTVVRDFLYTDAEKNEFTQRCSNQKVMITCNEQIENSDIFKEICLSLIYAARLLAKFFQGLFLLVINLTHLFPMAKAQNRYFY